MATPRRQPAEIIYPEEDGKVSESAQHYVQAMDLIEALRLFFANRPDVFVGGNLFVYYEQGLPGKNFSPDVLVALGVRPRPLRERGSYRVWEEGVLPQVIIELTSASTRRDDTLRKPQLYAGLGVQEYFLFDPLNEFLVPRLQGYRLNAASVYDRLQGAEFDSTVLGLRLVVRDDWLRLLDPATGELLLTMEEEHAGRMAAETEVARLRAELDRLRGQK